MADETPKEGVSTDPEASKANEVQQRANDFIKRYGDLVKETKMDFASFPQYVPDGQGGFRTIIQNTPVDITNQPVKSPFIQKKDL